MSMRVVFVLLLVVGITAGGVYHLATHLAADPPASFRTACVKRGDLLPTIGATGTVEPEEVVDVGAQVAGKIVRFGIDEDDPKKPVDYCSVVREGQVLAEIDDVIYKAQLDQAEAALQRAEADLEQLRARLEQTADEWKRAEQLRPAKAIAETDFTLAKAAYKTATANLAVGQAMINQSKAALELAEANFHYTIIKSPVNGTIIARRVNIGQTVVASLNAPSLFLIAKDLRRIQVWASVNEADIGRIRRGMPVRFTVDAFPGEVFRGKVLQVRLNANMTQNVVAYTVVVVTDNVDGKLLPYLTANLQFEVEHRTSVLQVPDAALRWEPQPQQIAPDAAENSSPSAAGEVNDKGVSTTAPSSDASRGTSANDREERGRLWIVEEGLVRPIDVKVGVSDGTVTEVSGDKLIEGMAVVVGQSSPSADSGESTNPFAPKSPWVHPPARSGKKASR
jgi:HlyD family secretion protein